MKKIISLLLVLVMVFSMTVFASAAGNSFTDIYNSKNEDAIEFLYDLGLVEGYSVTKFGPKKNLTRAEACALIVRALIEDDEIYASAKDNFVDVDDYAWYREWVDTAYRNHIMHGYGNGVFGPEDHVTYAQYATILVNALGYDSLDFEGTWPANVEELAVKLDLYDNVSVHVSDDEITREDAAQMLYNALWCKMVGMRGVTLYDVVTAEKEVTYTTRIKILSYTEKGWIEFLEEAGNVRWVHISDVYFVNHHGIEIGHIEWAEVTMNADYSEVIELVLIDCDTDIIYEHTHIDENFNGVCDRAECEVLTNNHTHVDNNYNDVCDYPGCTEAVKHVCIDDVNWDGKCDKCGKDTTVHSIVDVNKNGVCDYPGCKDKTPSLPADGENDNIDPNMGVKPE